MNLKIGATGTEVEKLQEKLDEFGYDVGPIDGDFGQRTRRAVIEFQEEHNFDPDGIITEDVGEELDISDEMEFPDIEPERASFRQFIVENPNYFGTYPELPFEQVTEKTEDTSYEELDCVGYDPGVERLEAVISIKRDYGYKGDICTDGSTEYVRFFIDRNRDGTWEDLGVASTKVYDIPGDKPIDYAVALALDEEEQLCFEPNLPRIRAILSWEDIPPAGDPDHRPPWGDRLEADIQIQDRDPLLGDVVTLSEIDEMLASGLDFDTPLTFTKQSLNTGTILEKYEDTSVPAHRAGFTEFNQMLKGGLPDIPEGPPPIPDDDFPPEWDPTPSDMSPQLPSDLPPNLDIEIGDIVGDLTDTWENTQYEELHCVGLERSTLTAVFTVKKPSGYLGGLCEEGSPEYVAFWEWDASAGGWSHLGTTSVEVHDIPGIPSDGLDYAAHLPVDLSHHRKPCDKGPSVVRIRAILSWNDEPPASDPSYTPTWGNRLETRVHVPPGPEPRAEGRLTIGTIGSVPTAFVEQSPGSDTNGTASGPSVSNGFTATNAPFGSLVTITGRPDDGLAPTKSGADSLKYRVSYRPFELGGTPGEWQHVTDEFDVYTYDNPLVPQPMTTDSDGFYTYVPGTMNDVLAKWWTEGDGIYELKVEAKRGDGRSVHTDVISFADGSTESEMYVKLDNTDPDGTIDITGYIPAGSSSIEDAAECEFLNVGDTILGEFTADDKHLRSYNLFVRPSGPANGAQVEETSSPTVLDKDGGDGTWELNTKWEEPTNGGTTTKRMSRCGYTVHVHVRDNTIVRNHYGGHREGDSEGFCLLGEGEEVIET